MRSRILISLLAVLALWWLIQIPAIFDPLMLFLTLGVNPFSGRELSPIVMVELLVSVLLLSIAVIFRKELRRGARRLFKRRQKLGAPDVVAVQAVPEAVVPNFEPLLGTAGTVGIAVDYDAVQGATVPRAGLQPLPVLKMPVPQPESEALESSPSIFSRLSRRARAMFDGLKLTILLKLEAVSAWWQKRVAPKLWSAVVWSGRFIVRTGQRSWLALQRSWWYCEPYCRRFDKWLERRVHQYETTSALVSLGREMEIVVRRAFATVRAWRNHPVILELLRSFRK